MSTNAKAVDVLAVMDREADYLLAAHKALAPVVESQESHDALRVIDDRMSGVLKALAAAAELQLRAAAMLAAASASAARREPLSADAPAIVNLRAALARIGGVK
jgi:hypothetical protein